MTWTSTDLRAPLEIRRALERIEPAAFQDCFTSWINALCARLDIRHVQIDGKALRGSRGLDGTCLHLVSAWVGANALTLGQVAVEDKSNEITAIPKLLRLLELEGALVSIDALGCQKEIAQAIRDTGADYLLQVKGNQPLLEADIAAAESRLQELEQQMASPDLYRDHEQVKQVTQAFEETKARIQQLYEHWEEAVELN